MSFYVMVKNNIVLCIICTTPWACIQDYVLLDVMNIGAFFLTLAGISVGLLRHLDSPTLSNADETTTAEKKEIDITLRQNNTLIAQGFLVTMIFSLICFFISETFIWKVTLSMFIFSVLRLGMTYNGYQPITKLLGKSEGNSGSLH